MQERLPLWKQGGNSALTMFLHPGNAVRPLVLVIPGGGYQCVCSPSEGAPIAEKFNQLGFHAAVLDYRAARGGCFPAPVEDAVQAMRILRANAEKWRVKPHGIAVCGFSAGGHLAACLGTSIAEKVAADLPAGDLPADYVPDALILCYGVVSFFDGGGQTADNLLGADAPLEKRLRYSPDCCITSRTPPAFLWHTVRDQVVDYRCSIRFAEAMAAHQRPCELHLFPRGDHGMLLGLDTPDAAVWPLLAKRFLRTQARRPSAALAERYTNAYQCFAEGAYPGPARPDPTV